MRLNSDYKNDALSALKGRWPSAVLAVLAFIALAVLLYVPFMVSAVAAQLDPSNLALAKIFLLVYFLTIVAFVVVLGPVLFGLVVSYRKLLVERDSAVTGNMFRFAFARIGRNALAYFLRSLFVFLWSLLLVVPGIIKSFSYAMTAYILDDEPGLSANQAINLSMRMMKGHKFDLFYLYLGFLGWILLSFLTFGIGFIFLYPYILCAQASFYQDVKADYLARLNGNSVSPAAGAAGAAGSAGASGAAGGAVGSVGASGSAGFDGAAGASVSQPVASSEQDTPSSPYAPPASSTTSAPSSPYAPPAPSAPSSPYAPPAPSTTSAPSGAAGAFGPRIENDEDYMPK